MRRFSEITRQILIVSVCLVISGCNSSQPRSDIQRINLLPGIAVLEIDDVFLKIEHDDGTGDLALFVANNLVETAVLRTGESFVLSNQSDHAQWYRIMLLSPEEAVLKRKDVYERRETQTGYSTTESVVSVKPYDLTQRRKLGESP